MPARGTSNPIDIKNAKGRWKNVWGLYAIYTYIIMSLCVISYAKYKMEKSNKLEIHILYYPKWNIVKFYICTLVPFWFNNHVNPKEFQNIWRIFKITCKQLLLSKLIIQCVTVIIVYGFFHSVLFLIMFY